MIDVRVCYSRPTESCCPSIFRRVVLYPVIEEHIAVVHDTNRHDLLIIASPRLVCDGEHETLGNEHEKRSRIRIINEKTAISWVFIYHVALHVCSYHHGGF